MSQATSPLVGPVTGKVLPPSVTVSGGNTVWEKLIGTRLTRSLCLPPFSTPRYSVNRAFSRLRACTKSMGTGLNRLSAGLPRTMPGSVFQKIAPNSTW